MSNIKLYKELQHLLYSGSVFEKEQIPVPLLQNSRYLNLINNAASVAGLFVEQKLKSRTKDGRTYIFEVK